MKAEKWKTRILSALIHAAVFAVCIGALFILTKLTEPQEKPQGATEAQTEGTAGEESGGDSEEAGVQDNLPEATASTAEAREDEAAAPWEDTGAGKDESEAEGGQAVHQEEEVPYQPPRIILATDLHYQSHDADDGGKAFRTFVEECDGKVVEYLPELLEAFLEEVIQEKPSALVLSGDLTMNGEKMNHEELADQLRRVRESGIPVLVIPGNHDINNTNAAVYIGEEKAQAPAVTAEEFLQIYYDYGYGQAFSRDETSLSYAYALDEKNWLLMLDSAQYDPVNLVEGRIQESTLEWMKGILEEAGQRGIFVLPIAHHNLLSQSRMYTTQCTMENHQEVIRLLEEYGCPLFLSGHLHVQRIHKHKEQPGTPDDAYGIWEIVTDALSIPPCQYGLLQWKEDGSLEYATKAVDVSAWAAGIGSENPDLLNFSDWSRNYISSLVSAQIAGKIRNLGDEVTSSMAEQYAEIYMDYYARRAIDARTVRSRKGYRWWQRNLPDSRMLEQMEAMMTDSNRDNNYFHIAID